MNVDRMYVERGQRERESGEIEVQRIWAQINQKTVRRSHIPSVHISTVAAGTLRAMQAVDAQHAIVPN